jgi:hypothetical protein
MPVQDVRLPVVSVKGEVRGEFRGDRGEEGLRRESSGMNEPAPRPAAVDAVRWGATLLTQLGLEPRHDPAAPGGLTAPR